MRRENGQIMHRSKDLFISNGKDKNIAIDPARLTLTFFPCGNMRPRSEVSPFSNEAYHFFFPLRSSFTA